MKTRKAALYVALLASLPCVAQAARIDYEIGASWLHSDNIGLNETDEVSDDVLSPWLQFSAEQTGSTLRFGLNGNVRYDTYRNNTFDDGVQGELAGSLNWTLLPERIDFVVEDNLTRQSVNVLSGYAPGNQQQVNVFTAGPTFRARFNESTRGQIDLRYIDTYAEESTDFNGGRYSIATQVLHRMRGTDELSFHVDAMETNNDDAGELFDYTRYDAYAGYQSILAAVTLEAELGYSRIEPKNTGDDSTSPMFRGDIAWRVSPRSTFTAQFNYELADAARNLAYRPVAPGGPVIDDPTDPGLPIGPQTFRQRNLALGYQFSSERLTLGINPYYGRIRYLAASTENQDITGITFNAEYQLRPLTTFSLVAVRQKREYDDIFRSDTSTIANFSIARQFTRHWNGRVYLQRAERDSSSFSQSYVENSVFLSISWRR